LYQNIQTFEQKRENKSLELIHGASDSCRNLTWYQGNVNREDRERLLNQKGMIFWFTGLPSSGKSTIAAAFEKELLERGKLAYLLDGDNIRYGLNSDLGFSEEDRFENIRRIGEVAKLFQDSGLIVLVAFISPFRQMRNEARQKVEDGRFIEVYVKADLQTCIDRDPKGLYQKAISGEIQDFTGISAPYEEPINPEIILDTTKLSVEESIEIMVNCLAENTI
jgi:adenylylsulfate kinase